jgi:hypothetical protein
MSQRCRGAEDKNDEEISETFPNYQNYPHNADPVISNVLAADLPQQLKYIVNFFNIIGF